MAVDFFSDDVKFEASCLMSVLFQSEPFLSFNFLQLKNVFVKDKQAKLSSRHISSVKKNI